MIIGMIGKYDFKGIKLPEAFARIDTVSSHDTHCTISVNVYANKESWANGEGYLEQIHPINFEKEIGDAVGDDRTQGYEFIVGMEQFSEWIEVVEP